MSRLRFAADENFNERILAALRRRMPGIDIARVRSTPVAASPDPVVLEWAAGERRIEIAHDVGTMVRDARSRVAAGLPMPGLIVVE